jgi:glyoxylase-like metal-dependent hydrolase (beta-lactamase superfamily II)
VVLVDSGRNFQEAEALRRILIERKLAVAAIINTHGHADHCGGNAYFKSAYPDLRIFATSEEQIFIENPAGSPLHLCGGDPPMEMLNDIYIVMKSNVTDEIPFTEHDVEIAGIKLHILPLPGHTSGMIGVKTQDSVLYVGDSILGQSLLKKYGVPYFTDIVMARETFEKLRKEVPLNTFFVLAHGGRLASAKIPPLVDEHINQLREIELFILDTVSVDWISLKALLQKLMDRFGVMDTVPQRYLTNRVLMAFVSFLEPTKAVLLEKRSDEVFIKKSI